MSKEKQQHNETMDYFFERYKDANFTVVPGHWPDFQTKEEVDEYINTTNKVMEAMNAAAHGYNPRAEVKEEQR